MGMSKIAITLDEKTLKRLGRTVGAREFHSRSRAIQQAVKEKLDRIEHNRLARECAKLDCRQERELAEEGMASELVQWPEYSRAKSAGRT